MARPEHRLAHRFAPVPQLSEWTPKRVRAVLREHERGQFRESALLAEAMERNPRIMAALQTRTLGLLGLPFAVDPSDDGDKRRAASVARDLEAVWWKIFREDAVADLHRWAVLMGVAFAEVVWDTSKPKWTPSLHVVHPYFTRFDELTQQFFAYTLDEGEVPITPGNGWMILGYSKSRAWMRGVIRCLGIDDTIRTYAVRDWARWSEKHGLPITGLVVPASNYDAEKGGARDTLSDLGNESTVILPQDENGNGYDLKLVEPKSANSWQGFQAQLDRVSADVAVAINGQVGTSDTKGGGSFAAAKVHERVRADYLEADAELWGTTSREQVTEPWAEYNYGAADLAPWGCYDATPPEDATQIATTLQTAGAAIQSWNVALAPQGQRVDVVELAEKFGMPVCALPPGQPAPAPVTAPGGQPGDPAAPGEQPPAEDAPAAPDEPKARVVEPEPVHLRWLRRNRPQARAQRSARR